MNAWWRNLLCILLVLAPVLAGAVSTGEKVRPAAVAGSWYPGDADRLATYLAGLLADARPSAASTEGPPVRALIVPHAGHRYSGATAAAAYRLVQGSHFRRVVVLGPAHRGGFHGLSIDGVAAYETPLGRIPLDLEAVNRLRQSQLVTRDPDAHRQGLRRSCRGCGRHLCGWWHWRTGLPGGQRGVHARSPEPLAGAGTPTRRALQHGSGERGGYSAPDRRRRGDGQSAAAQVFPPE